MKNIQFKLKALRNQMLDLKILDKNEFSTNRKTLIVLSTLTIFVQNIIFSDNSFSIFSGEITIEQSALVAGGKLATSLFLVSFLVQSASHFIAKRNDLIIARKTGDYENTIKRLDEYEENVKSQEEILSEMETSNPQRIREDLRADQLQIRREIKQTSRVAKQRYHAEKALLESKSLAARFYFDFASEITPPIAIACYAIIFGKIH